MVMQLIYIQSRIYSYVYPSRLIKHFQYNQNSLTVDTQD